MSEKTLINLIEVIETGVSVLGIDSCLKVTKDAIEWFKDDTLPDLKITLTKNLHLKITKGIGFRTNIIIIMSKKCIYDHRHETEHVIESLKVGKAILENKLQQVESYYASKREVSNENQKEET